MTGTSSTQSVRLLVVDDDPFLSSTLVFALQRVFPPKTVIRKAVSLEEAADLASGEPFHGVIVDYQLPDGHGADFLKSLSFLDGQRVALFLISGMDPNDIAIPQLLRQYPHITFIEKPFLYDAVARQVRDAVLPGDESGRGHYGLELFDLIQAYSLARKSATLRVELADGRMGTVAVRDGNLVHASLGAREGQEALLRIARRGKGHIRIEETCTTARHSIKAPTEHVLIETSRRLDEEDDSEHDAEEIPLSIHPVADDHAAVDSRDGANHRSRTRPIGEFTAQIPPHAGVSRAHTPITGLPIVDEPDLDDIFDEAFESEDSRRE